MHDPITENHLFVFSSKWSLLFKTVICVNSAVTLTFRDVMESISTETDHDARNTLFVEHLCKEIYMKLQQLFIPINTHNEKYRFKDFRLIPLCSYVC